MVATSIIHFCTLYLYTKLYFKNGLNQYGLSIIITTFIVSVFCERLKGPAAAVKQKSNTCVKLARPSLLVHSTCANSTWFGLADTRLSYDFT